MWNTLKCLYLCIGIATCYSLPSCDEEDKLECGILGSDEWIGLPWPRDETELNKACGYTLNILSTTKLLSFHSVIQSKVAKRIFTHLIRF